MQDSSTYSEEQIQNLTRELLLVTPLYLLVPVLFYLLAGVWDLQLELGWIALGAGGWLFALVLRGPVSLVARRLTTSTEAVQRAIILAAKSLNEAVGSWPRARPKSWCAWRPCSSPAPIWTSPMPSA